MRYPTAIGFIAMLTGCAITPAPSESEYARCGIDSGQWSVMPAPGDAEKLVAIARQHQGEPEGKDREIYWFASNRENAVLLCSAAHERSHISPNCFSNRWTFVNANGTWSLAKDQDGHDLVDSTICVD